MFLFNNRNLNLVLALLAWFIFPLASLAAAALPPEVVFSSYFGDSADDRINSVYVDKNGYIYIAGHTLSGSGIQSKITNAFDATYSGGEEGFVAKFTPDGSSIVYCTYLGGTDNDNLYGIVADDAGNAYVTGSTWSDTSGEGFSPFVNSESADQSLDGDRDVIFAKISPTGALLYCTYLGGSHWEYGLTIDLDEDGDVYIGGFTHYDFPVTAGARQNANTDGYYTDGFVTKYHRLSNTHYDVEYSTCVGGNLNEPVDGLKVVNKLVYATGHTQSSSGFPIVRADGVIIDDVNQTLGANQGSDGYFTKINEDGTQFTYSTYIGPEQSPLGTDFRGLEVDTDANPFGFERGSVYLIGTTEENLWFTKNAFQPTFGGNRDGVLIKLRSDFKDIIYSTFIGGTGDEILEEITLDNTGHLWVVGYTNSPNFPAGTTAYGGYDLFVLYMKKSGEVLWSNRYGGSGDEGFQHQDIQGDVSRTTNRLWITGCTASSASDFPVTSGGGVQTTYGGGARDGFITVIKPPAIPMPWTDEFDRGAVGEVPGGWESVDLAAAKAEMTVEPDSKAKIKVASGQTQGSVESRPLKYNTAYPYVHIKVDVLAATNWTLIMKNKTTSASANLILNKTTKGFFSVKYTDLLAGTNGDEVTFELKVAGSEGSYIVADFISTENWHFTFDDHFQDGTPGVSPSNWRNFNAPIAYSYAPYPSFAAVTRTVDTEGWGKIQSAPITADVDVLKYIEVSIADVSPNGLWKIGIIKADDSGETFYGIESNKRGIFEVAIPWTGTQSFRISLAVIGGPGEYVVLDRVRLRGAITTGFDKEPIYSGAPVYQLIPKELPPAPFVQPLMQAATTEYFGHFMLAFGTPTGGTGYWKGWNEADRDPNLTELGAPGRRQIAAPYYPYYQAGQPYPLPGVSYPPSLNGPYDQKDVALVQRHMDICQILGLTGGMFDLGSYYKIDDDGNLQPGVSSWQRDSMAVYLNKLQTNNLKAIPVYEEKFHFKWTDGITNRTDAVRQAYRDMLLWLQMYQGYGNVQYTVSSRPVMYLFGYEKEIHAIKGRMRLTADELYYWKNTYIWNVQTVDPTSGLSNWTGLTPILLANTERTEFPSEMEGTHKYEDVLEGYFEWPEFWGAPELPVDEHSLTEEILHWNQKSLISRYNMELGKTAFIGAGAWPGFDDQYILSWSGTQHRIIPRMKAETETVDYLYTYNYHLDRVMKNKFPVRQVVTFNDWWEGANIEPSVDFYAKYVPQGVQGAAVGDNETIDRMFIPVNTARQKIAEMKNQAVNQANLVVPFWGYTVRKEFPPEDPAQQAADDASANIAQGNYYQAESSMEYHMWSIASRTPTPTSTPSPTITPTSTPTPTITPTATETPIPQYLWFEAFNYSDDQPAGSPGQQAPGWYDETNDVNFNAEIAYATQDGLATVSTVSGAGWGKVQSFSQDVNLNQTPILEVVISRVFQGTAKVVVFSTTGGWAAFACGEDITRPGTYTFHLPTETGWSNTKSMGVELIVHGSNVQVDFDSVAIRSGSLHTVSQNVAWEDELLYSDDVPMAAPSDSAQGWAPTVNGTIKYDSRDGFAEVRTVSGYPYGTVSTGENITADLDVHRTLEVKIDQVVNGTVKVVVFRNNSFYAVGQNIAAAGTYTFDLPTLVGWTGITTLGIELIVEGTNHVAIFDRVRLYNGGTPTPTATPTHTPTATPQPSNAFFEEFVGTAGAQPATWLDETENTAFNAEIAYSSTTSLAAVTRTADSNWGKVLSPLITCDVSVHGFVEVQVASVTAFTSWKLGIQEEGGAWQYFDLSSSQTGTGSFKYNYASVAGWSGVHTFRVQLVVEGDPGKAMEVNWLRVGQEETVLGNVVQIIPPSPTYTKTPEPTATTVYTATATPTMTPTSTPTPWLGRNQVMAYPNPSRGNVNFAYTLAGSGKVQIDIYHLTGERVASITEYKDGGQGQTLTTTWEAMGVAPGIYICRILVTDSGGREVLKLKKKVALIR